MVRTLFSFWVCLLQIFLRTRARKKNDNKKKRLNQKQVYNFKKSATNEAKKKNENIAILY